ncbi:MAG TPA: sugar transferase [Terriglobales bacterium]|nr:sugar transferase [Terriglobales bacterium]
MRTNRTRFLVSALKLSDIGVMLGSILLVLYLVVPDRSVIGVSGFLAMRIKVQNFIVFFALVALWHMTFSIFGLYNSRRMLGRQADLIDSIRATSLGTFFFSMAALSFHIRMMSPRFLALFWATVTTGVVLQRFILRSVLERVRLRGRNLRHVLIVGTNSRALDFARKIEARPELGYHITGFVDNNWIGADAAVASGYPVVSDFNNLSNVLRKTVVDEVILALPVRSLHRHAARVASICEEQGITTRVLSNIFDLKLAQVRGEEFEGASLITNYIGISEGWPFVAKRVLDVCISSILLVGLAPLFGIVALLIKLTSKGPVFFVQSRLGYNKRRFKLYKFRSMAKDAEEKIVEIEHLNEASGPVFKIKNDPRVTALGSFLRKNSIDELPQLFNVLKGDMSLVGPRPLPVRDYEGFSEDWHRRRFSVRPGITCLWQINGRSSIPFDKWMKLDLLYIDRWSLRLDLEILLKTIPAVWKSYGAA